VVLAQATWFVSSGYATLSWDLPLPAGIADGEYILAVVVDPGNQITEADETNNFALGPVITVQKFFLGWGD
jgi:hypothetical protein